MLKRKREKEDVQVEDADISADEDGVEAFVPSAVGPDGGLASALDVTIADPMPTARAVIVVGGAGGRERWRQAFEDGP